MGTPIPPYCGSFGIGPTYPRYCVSWDDVAGPGGFAAQLNTYLGTSAFRLPTDAEHERATRAGTRTRFSHGDVLECGDMCEGCGSHDPYQWWCGNDPFEGGTSMPVATKLANGYGFHDLHGNLWEWVADWHTTSLGTAPVTDPTGPAGGVDRVVRGGTWFSPAKACRSASRGNAGQSGQSMDIGFRLARSAD